jgi:uncharacterized membrane protein YcaP (DUF421 family)
MPMETSIWHNLWQNLVWFGAPDTPVSLLEKVVRPVVVYLALVFWLRRFGKRLLAQLNPFDFVVLLMLSNTVQNAIIGNDTSLLGGLIGAATLLGVNAALVRTYYRGPSQTAILEGDRDICLMENGHLHESEMSRLRINAGELIARAHERGFDSLRDVHTVTLYPNGTLVFMGHHPDESERRHRALMERLEQVQREIVALRR